MAITVPTHGPQISDPYIRKMIDTLVQSINTDLESVNTDKHVHYYEMHTISGNYIDLATTYTTGNNSMEIIYNGMFLIKDVDYTETSSSRITFLRSVTNGKKVICKWYK